MAKYYTNEKNAQIIIALLKKHGIRKVVASAGTTNMALVGSMQYDPFFEMYSSVDERSAAYLACGLATESGEPVVISCTGATASRNYMPGLTEAFYRKLPILAITSTQHISKIGHHVAQVIDRGSIPNDVANLSLLLPSVNNSEDFWDCEMKVNQAILELKRRGGGPVHINLTTSYGGFDTTELPKVRSIDRICLTDDFPQLPKGRIGIIIGSHKIMSKGLIASIDKFCESNNAVVFCDHTSSYKGEYRVQYSYVAGQSMRPSTVSELRLMIHIGEVTGDYYSITMKANEVWRVSEDGEIRDTFNKLSNIFEMPEQSFFEYYAKESKVENTFLNECKQNLVNLRKKLPEVTFSNVWLASRMAHLIPENSVVHFAILNSLRAWNLFELPKSVSSMSNVGGFGIDGCISTLIGASFVNKNKIYYCVTGDLAFFYDMNVLGNRHLGSNIRILMVNNGVGTEFRQYRHHAFSFGKKADDFIAAAGHYGNKSPVLVKSYAESLGFEYLSASSKEEFDKVYEKFLSAELTNKPMLFEVFTNDEDESKALETILNVEENVKGKAVKVASQILGKGGISKLKKIINK
ncbi:thiamine pyrophosphate-binding protein [Cyclobacterium sp. 1_MG-2023]|uniref:thiamine pyrophosphate-binding protein n=1 Tax=Cyclobacterium sp. 1_MG-2023 TaxID=3062681 RepID=UPI0026E3A648|nr:thiamine pyrophosphate-binding protein [Cyclobacterium sp. 1_MG-2023]MDO6440388.1 thiamine pyrophosphate-binding protein [Cyclobacterium sp. 1_MG-2023]